MNTGNFESDEVISGHDLDMRTREMLAKQAGISNALLASPNGSIGLRQITDAADGFETTRDRVESVIAQMHCRGQIKASDSGWQVVGGDPRSGSNLEL